MAVSVPLDFMPPEEENITKLHIFEAPAAAGPFTEIEVVTAIGTWPDYIDHYTTDLATAVDDWFAIQWEDDKGAKSVMSSPIQGGVETIVRTIMDRVLQRDPQIDRVIALHEAEGATEWYFNSDPYAKTPADLDPNKKYRVMNGLTYLALARSYIAMAATHSNVEQASIGVVSFRTQAGVRSQVDIQQLIDLANELMGINTSLILQLEDVYNTSQAWQVWYQDWQVEWQQIPWILGLPHYELPTYSGG